MLNEVNLAYKNTAPISAFYFDLTKQYQKSQPFPHAR